MIGTHLPSALRTFLLTLAVVDDLLAITIIAVFYTGDLSLLTLLLAAGAARALRARRAAPHQRRWLLLPLASRPGRWCTPPACTPPSPGCCSASWCRCCAAGQRRPSGPASPSTSSTAAGRCRRAFAVPVFAFFAAGVAIGGWPGCRVRSGDPVAVGVVAGLVVGKPLGVLAATWAVARFTRADLDPDLSWLDVLGLAMLAGIGFTVSLLIGELAFGEGSARDDHVKVAVLFGSVLAAVLAATC